jgi:hypothetical protein
MGWTIFDEAVPVTYGKIFAGAGLASMQAASPPAERNYRVDRIIFTSNDTIDHELTVDVNNDGQAVVVGTIHIPAGAGYSAAIPAVELFAELPYLGDGVAFWNGGNFRIMDAVAISSTKSIQVCAIGGLL